MAEFHSLWNLQQAKQIARALEEYRPYWSEDPIKMCDAATLKEYADSTAIPVCGSETLGGTAPFRDMLQAQAVDIVMLDVGWCGGLTEARKIAALAEVLPAAGRAARLQRPGGVGRLDPPDDAHPQCAHHGGGARLLLHLVQGRAHRAAGGEGRLHLSADRARASAPGCCRTC